MATNWIIDYALEHGLGEHRGKLIEDIINNHMPALSALDTHDYKGFLASLPADVKAGIVAAVAEELAVPAAPVTGEGEVS